MTNPDDHVGRLIQSAGARLSAPADVEASVRVAVESEWLDSVRRRRRRYWITAAAVIAILALTATLTLGLRGSRTLPADAGEIIAVRGDVTATAAPGSAPIGVRAGQTLRVRTHVHTGAHAFASILVAGTSVRIGAGTEVDFRPSGALYLRRGRVYVDSPPGAQSAADIYVVTALGRIEHLGTQFEVEVTHETLVVRVREGTVRVATNRFRRTLHEAQALTVDRSGAATPGFIAPTASVWDWTAEVPAPFDIEGRTLAQFLHWFARESGYRVSFDSPQARSAARSVRLRGSIAGLTPKYALDAVMATTNLTYRLTADGRCRIAVHGGGKLPANEAGTATTHPSS